MKRELFQNITAIPYTSGDAIDKTGFLSAVIGANIAAGAKMTVKVEHSDDGETFEPVTDPRVFPEQSTKDGEYTFENPADAGAEDAEGELDTGGVELATACSSCSHCSQGLGNDCFIVRREPQFILLFQIQVR